MSDKLHLKAALRELANSDGICEDSAVSVRCILTALVTGKTTGTNVARIGDVIYMPLHFSRCRRPHGSSDKSRTRYAPGGPSARRIHVRHNARRNGKNH